MRFKTDLKLTIRSIVATAVMGALAMGCGGASSDQATSQAASPPKAKKPAEVAQASKKGIGPIDHVEIGPIDAAAAAVGEAIFDSKCAVCHKFEERYVGPALAGVTTRREPEWIMNMILNPTEMIEKDETAKALFLDHLTPMTFQNVTQEDAEALLTYFRSVDAEHHDENDDHDNE